MVVCLDQHPHHHQQARNSLFQHLDPRLDPLQQRQACLEQHRHHQQQARNSLLQQLLGYLEARPDLRQRRQAFSGLRLPKGLLECLLLLFSGQLDNAPGERREFVIGIPLLVEPECGQALNIPASSRLGYKRMLFSLIQRNGGLSFLFSSFHGLYD